MGPAAADFSSSLRSKKKLAGRLVSRQSRVRRYSALVVADRYHVTDSAGIEPRPFGKDSPEGVPLNASSWQAVVSPGPINCTSSITHKQSLFRRPKWIGHR